VSRSVLFDYGRVISSFLLPRAFIYSHMRQMQPISRARFSRRRCVLYYYYYYYISCECSIVCHACDNDKIYVCGIGGALPNPFVRFYPKHVLRFKNDDRWQYNATRFGRKDPSDATADPRWRRKEMQRNDDDVQCDNILPILYNIYILYYYYYYYYY
jgi:hypothetical protein